MTETQRFEVEIIRRQVALECAILNGRSPKWQLRLWGRLIKFRDGGRCLNCGDSNEIQAHHVMRRTLVPFAALDQGNGISLCRGCHHRVHAHFNGKPDPALPMGADQGDDQNEWSYLFGLLVDDAERRGLPQDECYFLSDALIRFSLDYQGYELPLDAL